MKTVSQEMKNILFLNTNKFIIEEGSLGKENPNNVLMALTLNKNLEKYGFCLDASSIRALSTQTPEELKKTWGELVDAVREKTGAKRFEKAKLFYPNFPEQVMETAEAQLYMNSMFYYLFSQTNDKLMDAIADEIRNQLVGEKEERLPLMEQFPRELNIINKGTQDDLFRMMNARIHSLNMSANQLEELKRFSNVYPEKFDEMISSEEPFQSKETKVKVALMLHEQGRDREIGLMLKDAVDVLRYAAMLSEKNGISQNNVELSPKDGREIAFKLTRAEQKQVKLLLNNCKGLYEDIWRQEKLFKRLMNRIAPTKEAGCPERVVKAFDNLAKGKKLNEQGKRIFVFDLALEDAIKKLNKTGDAKQLEDLAKNFSGMYMKAYVSTVKKTDPKYRGVAINTISEITKSTSIALRDVVKLKEVISRDEREQFGTENVARIYNHHGNKNYVKVISPENKYGMDAQTYDAMRSAVAEAAAGMVQGYQEMGNVYIDPALENNIAPGREMRDASGLSTYTKYSKIPSNPDKNLIIFGANWGQGGCLHQTHIDVDLSTHFYGEDYENKGYISYSSLKNAFGCHSGDWTHVPNHGTSTELIAIDKEKMKKAGVRYAVAEVHCYSIPNGNTFKGFNDCHFVMQQREGSLDNFSMSRGRQDGSVMLTGEAFEPSASECHITLAADASTTVPIVYDVKEDRCYWLDASITQFHTQRCVSVTEDPRVMKGVILEIEQAHNNVLPSMKDLFEAYATHNGTIVEDITQADTVFVQKPIDAEQLGLKEGARVITAFDLDVISKEFSGNDDQSMLQKEEPEKVVETPVKEAEEPALVKQLRYLSNQLGKFPRGIRMTMDEIDVSQDRNR